MRYAGTRPVTCLEQTALVHELLHAVIGEGCRIADHASTLLAPSLFSIEGKVQKAEFGAILGDRVTTAPFTSLRTCIVGNGVTVREGRTLSQIIPDNSLVM